MNEESRSGSSNLDDENEKKERHCYKPISNDKYECDVKTGAKTLEIAKIAKKIGKKFPSKSYIKKFDQKNFRSKSRSFAHDFSVKFFDPIL